MKNTIMLVDDVPASQDSSTALLTAEGYEVSTASDGEGALELLSKHRSNAVLFQILDPANGAINFVRLLALSRHVLSVPVVLVTVLNEFQLGSFLNGIPGVRKVLYSPCPPAVLKDAVAQAVRYFNR